MLNQQELNKLCEGLEKIERKDGIRKIIDKGYRKESATNIYNSWRKYYVTTLFNIT